ncbi:MAG: hypothetical protein HYU76_03165 [Betaproteobacteria bacterium]|nr:hypothetical protein [Betaproteobacteria bacterium]
MHRIGRTGRAGASGQAVSLVCGEDRLLLAAIERLINRRIEQRIVAGFEPGQSFHAPAAQPGRPQHRHPGQGRQPAAQPRHGNGSDHRQKDGQARRHEPRATAHGQHSGQQPQRPQAQQRLQSRQHPDRGNEQPAPERARTQAFPALLGTFGRKAS